MGWRDNLRRASFRGAAFFVEGASSEHGRRIELHEFPQRDTPYAEDLGRKARHFSIEAFVLGDDYMGRRDALVSACEAYGPGSLVHPYMGSKRVACTECRVSESASKEGRMARLSLTFVEAGGLIFPGFSLDTVAGVLGAVTAALAAVQAGFAGLFQVTGRPNFVADAADALLTRVATATGSAPMLAVTLPPITLAAQVVTAVQAMPATGSGRWHGVETGAGRLAGLFDFGADLPAVPETTASRRQQAANQAALCGLMRQAALIEAARAVAMTSFPSREQALAVRDDLANRLDAEMLRAADAIYSALCSLRVALVKDVTARAADLKRILHYRPAATLPALVVAHRLYLDATRANEIVTRNRVRHPGFLPGGLPLEVYSD